MWPELCAYHDIHEMMNQDDADATNIWPLVG